jgi:RNA polymerase sigma-70 factor (ECF subfamily)
MFVEVLEAGEQQLEDLDTARLITRIQAGEDELFALVYMRHFDRIYRYLRTALRDPHEAEDLTQQVFIAALEAIGRFEVRSDAPFRTWLIGVARNKALTHWRKHGRVEVEDPERLSHRLECSGQAVTADVLGWVSDRELALFVERLPLAQREVLTLRFLLGLTPDEIGDLLGRSPAAVRQIQHRALTLLRERLAAIGRPADGMQRSPVWAVLRQRPVIRTRRFALAASAVSRRR